MGLQALTLSKGLPRRRVLWGRDNTPGKPFVEEA